ncbi:MAG: hypothetical protein J5I94_18045 [Phaeodactylibacter sp.]|nr:hypothetical protein [Phaeodactylibacter sp.]
MRKRSILVMILGLGLIQGAFARTEQLVGYWLPVDSSQAGQATNNERLPSPAAAPRLNLKNGTLSLFDPYAPSFNIAVEHIIRPRLYAHLEGGPLVNLRFFPEPAVDNLKGYRFRGAIRYYLRPNERGDFAPFIELMYAHQYTDADIEGDFSRNNEWGWYRQRLTYHMEQRKHGGFINMGLQQVYAKGFIFEFGAGLGVRNKREDFSGVPPDADFRTNGALGWEYSTFGNSPNVAAVQVYINLGYVLK